LTTIAKIEANRRNALRSTGPRTPEGRARSAVNHASHWLTCTTILVPGEDPEVLQRLQEELTVSLQPVGALEELLADRIVSATWRLRRAARAERELIGLSVQEGLAARAQERLMRVGARTGRRVASFLASLLPEDFQKLHEEALREEEVATETLSELSTGISKSFLVEQRGNALERVGRYEKLIENQLYRALHELERLQAKRSSQMSAPPLAVDVSIASDAGSLPELVQDVARDSETNRETSRPTPSEGGSLVLDAVHEPHETAAG
jgi:hypothetical protein